MKNLFAHGRVIAALAFVVLIAIPVSAQLKTPGEAVDVVDGRTVVVVVPAGRVNVELPYVEVPEPSQALHESVRDHVKHLVIGKQILLQTTSITRGKVTGKLTVNGVDLGQQLLRDGAAWHVPMAVSGQNKQEFDAYAESEALARLEKRGVWSVAGLEPAWEFREKQRAAEQAVIEEVENLTAKSKTSDKPKKYWSDSNPRMKRPALLSHGFNAPTQTGFLATPLLGVSNGPGLPEGQKTAVQIYYFYTERNDNSRTGYFLLRIVSSADEWRFTGTSEMTLEVDGKKFPLGKPAKETGRAEFKQMEKLDYELDASMVNRIANGNEVFLRIGTYMLVPKPVLQMILHEMLVAATSETNVEEPKNAKSTPREKKKVVKN